MNDAAFRLSRTSLLRRTALWFLTTETGNDSPEVEALAGLVPGQEPAKASASRRLYRFRSSKFIRLSNGWLAILLLALAVLSQYARLVFREQILGRGDSLLYFYPYWSYRAEALRAGHVPLWQPILFGGAPFLANSQAGVLYPLNWLLVAFAAPVAVKISLLGHIGLAAGLMVAYGRRSLRLDWPAAWTAAVLFALSGYLTAKVEHINQIQGLAWLPGLFLLFDCALRAPGRRMARPLAGLALIVDLQLLAGHTQSAFISLTGLGLYALWHTWQRTLAVSGQRSAVSSQPFLLWLAGGLAGAALAAGQLLPTLELSRLSTRASGLPVSEALSFSLNPLLLGRALLPGLGQTVFSEYVAYLGLAGLILAGFGLPAIIRSSWFRVAPPNQAVEEPDRRYALLLLAAVGLLFALGRFDPLYILLARFVPGFGLFRVPARWLVLFVFGTSGLAGLGLQRLAQGDLSVLDGQRRLRRILVGLLGLGSVAVAGAAMAIRLGLAVPGDEVHLSSIVAWLIFGCTAAGLIWARVTHRLAGPPFAWLIAGLVFVELLVASQVLPPNQLTSPQAWSSMRPALAYFLAAQQADRSAGLQNPPDRLLSSSQLLFDPGDLPELTALYGRELSSAGVYDLVVASKLQEVASPNLPLAWGIPTFDGYDGGVLPLARWVTLAEQLGLRRPVPDGRLREQLAGFPPARLLSLLNVRYFVTDRTGDNWQAGVFYDLGHPVHIDAAQPEATVADIPPLESTALGLIAHLEGAAGVADGQVVAEATVTFPASTGVLSATLPIRAGIETAEGPYPAGAHYQPLPLAWPDQPDYPARLSWSSPAQIPSSIVIRSKLPTGQLIIRGLALIDERTGAFQNLTLSTEGRWRLAYAGDVKIYENLDTLPRAYLVRRAQRAESDQSAQAMLADPSFDPAQDVILVAPEGGPALTPGPSPVLTTGEGVGGEGQSSPAGTDPLPAPVIQDYQAERVAMETSAPEATWLVLSDSFYPGWHATLDGQPVPIYRANLLFRAIPVPAGQHQILFWYQPESFRLGLTMSLITLVVGLVAVTRRYPPAYPDGAPRSPETPGPAK